MSIDLTKPRDSWVMVSISLGGHQGKLWKYYPENFAFLILKVFELSTRKDCKKFFTNIQKQ